MVRIRRSPGTTFLQLEDDIAVQILTHLPDLTDKLAFGSACQASNRALKDPRSWDTVNVKDAVLWTGDPSVTAICSRPLSPSNGVFEGSELIVPHLYVGAY